MDPPGDTRKLGPLRIPRRIQRISWRDLVASLGPVLLVSVVAIWIAVRFVRPAPPDTIVMTSGPEGSISRVTAEKYRKILARNAVKLEILPSEGRRLVSHRRFCLPRNHPRAAAHASRPPLQLHAGRRVRGGSSGADHRGADPRHATGAHDLRLACQEPHERTVITAKMPGSVANQIYVLRQHITWVHERLAAGAAAPS